MLLEARVGEGRLLISTMNLGVKGERSLAQEQMLKSLLDYAGGKDFNPAQSLSMKHMDGMFLTGNNQLWTDETILINKSSPHYDQGPWIRRSLQVWFFPYMFIQIV